MIDERDADLRERLRATIEHVAQQPAARKLCLALALAEGFTFQLVVCNSPRVATALQLWLEEAVASERGEPIWVERLSPYPFDPSDAGPSSLDGSDLSGVVLESLVGRSGGDGRMVFVDASWAKPRDAEAWRWVLLRLNERRNLIARELGAPLTLIIPPLLEVDVGHLAPDLWSIRSVVVQVDDLDVGVAGATLLHAFEASYRSAEDIAALQEEVERARVWAASGDELAARALRVLLLRLAGAKQLVGELDQAERLIDEASSSADDESTVACALARSDILRVRGELDEALRLVDSTFPMLHRLGDDWTLANAWGRRADILQARGKLDEALRIHWEEELPAYERLGDTRDRAVTMGKIADILEARGELDEALRIYQDEELPVYERLGDIRSRAVTMSGVADILEARGELDEALRIRREEELPVYEQLGAVHDLLVGRANLALTLAQRGRSEDRPEIDRLLALALRDARRLRLSSESRQIESIIRSIGRDPDAPPFA